MIKAIESFNRSESFEPVVNERRPVAEPLMLTGEHLDRYLEIRMLRLLFDRSGHRPITWNEDGQAVPGQWKMRPHKIRES